jgi:hypothetical protein
MNEVLIPVKISKGLFSDENLAEFVGNGDAEQWSVFVHKSLLSERSNEWFLKAHRRSAERSDTRVLLPVETNETFSRWVDYGAKVPA